MGHRNRSLWQWKETIFRLNFNAESLNWNGQTTLPDRSELQEESRTWNHSQRILKIKTKRKKRKKERKKKNAKGKERRAGGRTEGSARFWKAAPKNLLFNETIRKSVGKLSGNCCDYPLTRLPVDIFFK